MIRIGFHVSMMCIRGTSTANYDYANYNEKILGNVSIIIIPRSSLSKNDAMASVKFIERFRVIIYDDEENSENYKEKRLKNLEKILDMEGIEVLYHLKYGKNEGLLPKGVKNAIHCVFDMSEPHGNVYAGVSRELAAKFSHTLFVPHMIGLEPSDTENWRQELNIPESSVVFGRHGGPDTFNLPFAYQVIWDIVNEKDNTIHFLFMNTPLNFSSKFIHHVPKGISNKHKNKFISTCDAHLELGTLGHSFGLSIGEFSVHNKPIICYKPTDNSLWNTAHLAILGEKALYVNDYVSLYKVLKGFPKNVKGDFNCYKNYSPEIVMRKFEQIFLK